MDFRTTHQSTVGEFQKASIQLSQYAYPKWVPWIITIFSASSVFIMTLLIILLLRVLPFDPTAYTSKTFIYIIAICVGLLLSFNFVMPHINKYCLRFARFDPDFETLTHYHIDASGIRIDDADRTMKIGWSAISGVFETKDLVAFYCRGLNYYVPKYLIGDKETQKQMIELWSNWQKAAETSAIAKNFA